jgi:hypothetical protein
MSPTNPTNRRPGSLKGATKLLCPHPDCQTMREVAEVNNGLTEPAAWLSPCGHRRTAALGEG